jgi:hypothetical protein
VARTLSTAQEDILTSAQYEVHTRLEVEDSTGAFINVGSLGGGEWFESALWDWSLDQPVAQMTLALRRDQGPSTGESLAPLDEESTFNVNAASAYAPLLDAGREIKFYTAATTVGGPPPSSGDFDFIFQGEIDDVNWQLSPLTLIARSKFLSQMADRFVEEEQVYGSVAGVALETVIQSILDDWTDLSITLFTPVSPGFLISPPYRQQRVSVLDAVTTLAQLIGWELREIFDDGTNAWRLRLAEPNRSATSSDKDFTFDASQYYNVNQASISRDDVRNVVNVIFGTAPSSSSPRPNVLVESTSSIDRFGRRWIEDEEGFNSSIDTSSEANTLANAILDDLKDPAFRHEIEVPYFWPGEIGDYYEFLKNDIHYSTDQFLGVYGISHELRRDRHRTLIRVRGQPAGQYLSWQQYPGGGNTDFAEMTGIEVGFNADGEAVVSVAANELSANVYVTVGNDTDPADPTAAANDGSLAGKEGVIETGVKITQGGEAHVRAVSADIKAILGPIKSVRHQRRIGPFHKDTTARATPGSTSLTTLETITVPADVLGSDGVVVLTAVIDFTGGNAAKNVSLTWDGSVVAAYIAPASFTGILWITMFLAADGGTSAQEIWTKFSDEQPTVDIDRATPAADTTADVDILIRGAVDNGTDAITLQVSLAELLGTN